MFKVPSTKAHLKEANPVGVKEFGSALLSLKTPVSALHQSGIGLIIIGAGEKTLLMNREAWSILAKGKALSLYRTDFLKAFPRAIYQAIMRDQTSSLPMYKGTFQSGQRQYAVWIAPLFKPNEKSNISTGGQKMIVLERIFIKNPNLPLLIRKFKLTPREGQVVQLLFNGKSDKSIGLSLGLSIETVRGHMRHIRLKMNAASRLEVISLLLGT